MPINSESIDPQARYIVKLGKPVRYDHAWMRPSDARVVVTGQVLAEISDAVVAYEKVK